VLSPFGAWRLALVAHTMPCVDIECIMFEGSYGSTRCRAPCGRCLRRMIPCDNRRCCCVNVGASCLACRRGKGSQGMSDEQSRRDHETANSKTRRQWQCRGHVTAKLACRTRSRMSRCHKNALAPSKVSKYSGGKAPALTPARPVGAASK
jgi:hypothetical protein